MSSYPNAIYASPNCAWCAAKLGEAHSNACPNSERYKEVQRLGGVPMPKVTRDEAIAFLSR